MAFLRNLAVNHVWSHWDQFRVSVEASHHVGSPVEYMQYMGVDGRWGDEPELVALANALGCCIKVSLRMV